MAEYVWDEENFVLARVHSRSRSFTVVTPRGRVKVPYFREYAGASYPASRSYVNNIYITSVKRCS